MHDLNGDLMICSWGDTLNAERPEHVLDSPERIRDALVSWKETYGIAGVLWRQERWLARFARITDAARRKEPQVYDVVQEVDDAKAATEAARDAGVKIYCYVDLYDEGQPPHSDAYTHDSFTWESEFFATHPEYYACDRTWDKRHWGVPEYWYPEVRDYKCRQELAWLVDNYRWDGVYVSTRGHRMNADHGDQYGFNLPVAEAFRERYGVDILTENFDLEAWRRLRGESITQYLRDVRALCDERGLTLGIGVPPGDHFGRPVGNIHLDWRTWIAEKIIDGINVGHANVVGRHLRTGYGYVQSYFDGEFGLQAAAGDAGRALRPALHPAPRRTLGQPDDPRAAGQDVRQELHERAAAGDPGRHRPVVELGQQGRPHADPGSGRRAHAVGFGGRGGLSAAGDWGRIRRG